MASNLSDDARRADILLRAHAGLEEDLDDMRADLMDILPDYEQRLRRSSDALPSWLEISAAQVRALFHLRPVGTGVDAEAQPTSSVHGILGPRTVALAAGRIETFIDRGFVDADFDDETRMQGLIKLYTETSFYLGALIGEARRVAGDARATLNAWLDALLFELEDRRKRDVEALEDLVGQGEIGRGDTARQEIADLWEDQRHRAASLQTSWQPLTALVREGLAITESGLEELSELLVRARAGLIGANASIEPQLPPFEWPVAPGATARMPSPRSAEIDEAGPTLDMSQPTDHALEASLNAASTDASRSGAAARDVDTFDAQTGHDAFNTLPEASYVPGIIPLDEPTSDPVTEALESSSVSDYSEPSGEDAGAATLAAQAQPAQNQPAQTARTTTQRMYTRADTPSSGHAAAPEPVSRHTEPTPVDARKVSDNNSKVASAPRPATGLSSDEATYTQCFRIRPGYKPAGWLEVLAVALPPAIVLGVITFLSLLHLAGLSAEFNPFERWPWAFSAVAASLAWLLLLPALRRWRSKWRGTRLIIMRLTDVREEAALRFDAHALTLDDTTWRWDALNLAELRRWDSPLDEVCGWSLAISTPNTPALRLASPESNRKKWQHSPYQLAETPYDAWQVSAFDFDTIARRAL